MASSTICPQCGKPKEKRFPLCQECFSKSRSSGGSRDRVPINVSSGKKVETRFKSFYTENSALRREIFIEAAEEMANELTVEGMTQTQIRSMFNMLNEMAQRIKREGDDLNVDVVSQQYYEFVRQCEYQKKRGVFKGDAFLQFAKDHLDVAASSKKEFIGFVEYLKSIMARLKTK